MISRKVIIYEYGGTIDDTTVLELSERTKILSRLALIYKRLSIGTCMLTIISCLLTLIYHPVWTVLVIVPLLGLSAFFSFMWILKNADHICSMDELITTAFLYKVEQDNPALGKHYRKLLNI
jgi:hypothetical protein